MHSHLKMRLATSSLLSGVFFLSALTASATLTVLPVGEASADDLLPHRAVYELMLEDADRDSGVTGAAGLFAFQITGSSCTGWNVASDIVLTILDRNGDPRRTESIYRTFEDANADVFTFETTTTHDDGIGDRISGAIERAPRGDLTIRRLIPDEIVTQAERTTLFPGQLTRAILQAGEDDQRLFFGTVFDGSHDEGLAQPVTAIVGQAIQPSVVSAIGGRAVAGDDALVDADTMPIEWSDFPAPREAWPVHLSYFNPSDPDSGPSFQVAYTLDSNGVSDDLILNYGAFRLRGVLSDFVAFRPSACSP